MNIVEKYQKALDAVYEHVGFKEDWVVCPLDEQLASYWYVDNDIMRFANSIEQFFSDGDYYEDDLYTQRFYSKWVYEGADFTMVFCDPHVDGMKWFRLFDNNKRIKTLNKDVYFRKDKLEAIGNLIQNEIETEIENDKGVQFKKGQVKIYIGKHKLTKSLTNGYLDLHIVYSTDNNSGYNGKFVRIITFENIYDFDTIKSIVTTNYEDDIQNIMYVENGGYLFNKASF